MEDEAEQVLNSLGGRGEKELNFQNGKSRPRWYDPRRGKLDLPIWLRSLQPASMRMLQEGDMAEAGLKLLVSEGRGYPVNKVDV